MSTDPKLPADPAPTWDELLRGRDLERLTPSRADIWPDPACGEFQEHGPHLWSSWDDDPMTDLRHCAGFGPQRPPFELPRDRLADSDIVRERVAEMRAEMAPQPAPAERPGGWVNGIGWVARMNTLAHGDRYRYDGDGEPGDRPVWVYEMLPDEAECDDLCIVVGWADGTTPAPSPGPLVDVTPLPEWEALIVAATAFPRSEVNDTRTANAVNRLLRALAATDRRSEP